MWWIRRRARSVLSRAVAGAVAGSALIATPALGVDPTGCPTVEGVWARGSGQELGAREFRAFRDGLRDRISEPATFAWYELGSASRHGNQYPAVAVGAGGWTSIADTIGAAVSSGQSFRYGSSVNDGVAELSLHLEDRAERCPGTVFVLGGYSQGAQVVGQAYERLGDRLRLRVGFSALFGDPRLHLPEGEGIIPPACFHQDFSPWRRTVPICHTDNGSLGARKPYLPLAWTDRTGTWCDRDDFVCGSSKTPWTLSGHMTYADEGGAVDEAVREIVQRLGALLPGSAHLFDSSITVFGAGTTGLDVLVVLDSTGSMGGRLNAAKVSARAWAAQVVALRGRVALVEYRDAGDAFVARTLVGLTDDLEEFETALAGVSALGGGDTPEALLAALMEGFDTLDWQQGASKAAIVLTDAGYHDPDRATGDTGADVVRRSLEIDPVNVYPVVPAGLASFYGPLAEQTSGRVVVDSGDTADALIQAVAQLRDRPVVLLPLDAYLAPVGASITFDASRSYAPGSTIVDYAWDFDGDGSFDLTTTDPVVAHVYPGEFDGVMQVRATATNGTVGSFSAPVVVTASVPDDGRAAAPASVTVAETDDPSRVVVSWEPGDDRADRWGIAVNGIGVGYAEAAARSLVVLDVERAEDVELTVHGINAASELGTGRSAWLASRDGSDEMPGAVPEEIARQVPAAVGTLAPTPSPVAAETRADGPGASRLPRTGAQIGATLLVALALAGGGVATVVLVRRRTRRG